jgi:hypothetical protein
MRFLSDATNKTMPAQLFTSECLAAAAAAAVLMQLMRCWPFYNLPAASLQASNAQQASSVQQASGSHQGQQPSASSHAFQRLRFCSWNQCAFFRQVMT